MNEAEQKFILANLSAADTYLKAAMLDEYGWIYPSEFKGDLTADLCQMAYLCGRAEGLRSVIECDLQPEEKIIENINEFSENFLAFMLKRLNKNE